MSDGRPDAGFSLQDDQRPQARNRAASALPPRQVRRTRCGTKPGQENGVSPFAGSWRRAWSGTPTPAGLPWTGRFAVGTERRPRILLLGLLVFGYLISGCEDSATTPVSPAAQPAPPPEPPAPPEPGPGPGLDIFDFPLRAIAISGNWGTNRPLVEAWEDTGGRGPLIPTEYIDWLQGLHANWILISVALHVEDSLDSTVSRETGRDRNVPTWRDDSLRQLIREFRENGFDVYLTLAFEAHEARTHSERPVARWLLGDPAPPHTGGAPPHEPPILPENWPWRPGHQDHRRFVAEFWETYADQAVHFARIAEDEGVRLYSLGTESDRLFRSRPDPADPSRPEAGYMHNDFGDELRSMVDRVRGVYSGRLTYDMQPLALLYADHYGIGSGAGHLWEDLDLDIVGISGWPPLTEEVPTTVMSVRELEAAYEEVFRTYLVPLAGRNPGRALVFTEYHAMDVVEAPADTASSARQGEARVFTDEDRNGLDDGEETQANIFQAFFNTSERYPGIVNDAFFWDNWITTEELWLKWWAGRRNFDIRGKLAEEVVRTEYARRAQAGRMR